MEYKHNKIEKKWQKIWRKKRIYQPDLENAEKPFYNLMMFPYPSAKGLHVGNMYAFTGSDIYGRFKRMQGYDVFEPIGLDGFGIHSENYALKINKHPLKLAKKTEKYFYSQLQATGNGYAWENTLETYDPDYYKWTQWLFIQMFKNGLAYRQKSAVNWCPSCKTVLADEQVISGKCERCGTEVVVKELEQWFFRITKYAERLLNNLDKINWSEKVKIAQRNWIGRSEGVNIEYEVVGQKEKIVCFTTRPETNFGATFVVLSPFHPLVLKITKDNYKKQVVEYIEGAKKRKVSPEETAENKEKTGVFTGSYCLNKLNGKKMPIWVSDFVLDNVGTGAVVGVPAHDKRDFEFAQKFNLEVIRVIVSEDGDDSAITSIDKVYEGHGKIINSGFLNGLNSREAKEKITEFLEEREWGKREVLYKLRDWCISRQRYWGPPIPMIKCPKCGWVPVPEEELPVKLPYLKDYRPIGTGESPLDKAKKWLEVNCPVCGSQARRETDVSDTFLDSSWYFLRYPSIKFKDKPFDKRITKKWLPVNMYIGGAEHSVLHLMYARFITMVLFDLGYIDFEEPFTNFYAHGLIISQGAKMSKNKGNVVIPDEYIKKYGADALRMYLMFLGPFDQGGDFNPTGIIGIKRFLNRVFRLSLNLKVNLHQQTTKNLERALHRTIKKVTEDIENKKYNTAIACLIEFANLWEKEAGISVEDGKKFIKLLAPFAPHLSEEIWEILGGEFSIHQQPWPEYDPALVKQTEFTIIIQINGKLRDKLIVSQDVSEEEVKNMALNRPKVKKWLENKEIKKVVFVPNKLINFVV